MATEPTQVADADEQSTTPEEARAAEETAVVEDVLVEEVSIDGMCGVY